MTPSNGGVCARANHTSTNTSYKIAPVVLQRRARDDNARDDDGDEDGNDEAPAGRVLLRAGDAPARFAHISLDGLTHTYTQRDVCVCAYAARDHHI